MYIYPWQSDPTPQSIKHRCLEYPYTKLGRSSRYSTVHIYVWLTYPQSIEHRCLEYCYIKLGRSSRYSTMHIYVWQTYPPGQSTIDALNAATPNLADIAQCTYMHGRPTPWLIMHRCLEYQYTKLGKSSRYSTMNIYALQTYPLQLTVDPWQTTTLNKFNDRLATPPPPVDHRCMADH